MPILRWKAKAESYGKAAEQGVNALPSACVNFGAGGMVSMAADKLQGDAVVLNANILTS